MLANLSTQRRKEMIKISTLLLRKQENTWWFDQAKKTFLSFLRKKFSRNISEKKTLQRTTKFVMVGFLQNGLHER